MSETLERIRASLIGLRMPRALEALDHTMRRIERGELTPLEAIDGLLAEEHATRESRRVAVALKTARLTPPKTLESFDFSFQPPLDRGRILALAQLDFVARAEVVHFLGSPAPARATSPPPWASRRSVPQGASTALRSPRLSTPSAAPSVKAGSPSASASMPGQHC